MTALGAATQLCEGEKSGEKRAYVLSRAAVLIAVSLFTSQLQTHEVVDVCAKVLYQVELNRGGLDIMWGFSVEAELVENSEKQDELCCYVSRVEDRSVAMTNGELIKE
jgi:hypothetical protein